MAIVKIEKNENYTIMSNYHLRDKNLGYKAKGLLSFMLSLPEDWDYSIEGLVKISKDGKRSISSTLNELKENSYLKIEKFPPTEGNNKFTYVYTIYEYPYTKKQNQDIQNVDLENKENPETVKQDMDNEELQPVDIQNVHLQNEELQKDTQINTNKQDKIDKTIENLNYEPNSNKNHSKLTNELLKLGYITNNDYLENYDRLFVSFLSKGEKEERLMAEINYIVPKVIENKFKDENGKPISNKYGYLKNAIISNFKCMDIKNNLKDKDLFNDEYDWLNDD